MLRARKLALKAVELVHLLLPHRRLLHPAVDLGRIAHDVDLCRRGLVEQAVDGVGGELSVQHVELVLAVNEVARHSACTRPSAD